MTCLSKRRRKYLLIRSMPLTCRLSLFELASDPIINRVSAYPDIGGVVTKFTSANTSHDWSILNVHVKCDLVTLDSSLQNSYAEHVLSGKNLPINYSTYVLFNAVRFKT